MFATSINLFPPYSEVIAQLVRHATCHHIGLKIEGGLFFEYPLWQIARHAGANLTFTHVWVVNESAKAQTNGADSPPCALVLIGFEESGDPPSPDIQKFRLVWSRSPIRLLIPTAAS